MKLLLNTYIWSASLNNKLLKSRRILLVLNLMRTRKISPQQIVTILKKLNNNNEFEKISNAYGISAPTSYKWRSKYTEMNSRKLKRLEELEQENRKLRAKYKNLTLDY